MRLQLRLARAGALVAALAAATSLAHAAEGEPSTAGARVDVYIDEHIVVVAPQARTSVEIGEDGLRVDGGHLVNVISGATPVLTADAITSATRFTEVRHGLDLSLSGPLAEHVTLRGGAMASLEGDFQTAGPTLSLTGDAFGEMSRFAFNWRLRVERVTPGTGEPLADVGVAQEIDLTWTQILSRTTRMTVLLSGHAGFCGETFGCQANPYRYVPVGDFSLREKHPHRRFRFAAGARVSQSLAPPVALHGGYRFYVDTWRVHAHTADLAVAVALLGDRFIVRTSGRFGWQSGAAFYRDEYALNDGDVAPAWVTGDRELSRLWDVMVAVRGEWRAFAVGPFDRLSPSLRFAHVYYRYPDYSESPQRHAWLVGAGVDAVF